MGRRNKCQTKYCRNTKAPGRNYCHKCRNKKYKERNPVMYAYHVKKANAKNKGVAFDLTYDEFKTFVEGCGYLESKGVRSYNLHIDRPDPTQGYNVNNIRPATSTANAMLRTQYYRNFKIATYE